MYRSLSISRHVKDITLKHLAKYLDWNSESRFYFLEEAGTEHYKLLAYLGLQLPPETTVIDIGTSKGASALAFSMNRRLKVITYDIEAQIPKDVLTIRNIPSIECRIQNALEDIPRLLEAPLILLDIDPHDGIQEKTLIQSLMKENYRGIVLCDDIHLNPEMKAFWDWVPLKKIDATSYGHITGTGIILFDESYITVSNLA